MTLHKDFLQVGEVMVILAGDTSYHNKGLRSDIYTIVSIKHGKVSFMLIVNGDRHLFREIVERLLPCHGEGSLWILKTL